MLLFTYNMTKIEMKIGSNSYVFGIKNYKLLLGKNIELKTRILDTIKKEFKRIENSDYSFDNSSNSSILINDKEINLRQTKLYEINHHYNYLDEYKLKSSSLVLNYLRNTFNQVDYSDVINTINILISELNNELTDLCLSQTSIIDNRIYVEELNTNNIFKLMNIKMFKDDVEINEYDLSYNEKINYQLEMVKTIAEKSYELNHIVLLELPKLTKEILDYIKTMKYDNLIIIIVTNSYDQLPEDISNIITMQKQFIDYRDEIDIYDKIIMNLEEVYTIEDFKPILYDYLTNKEQKINFKLSHII